MNKLDSEVRQALDLRLARGEIEEDEYRRLTGLLIRSTGKENQSQAVHNNSKDELIMSVEDLEIYSKHILVDGRRREFSEIVYVDGGLTKISINLLPAVKHTSLEVRFKDGKKFKMDEQRSIFGRKRHKRIAQAVNLIKKLSFKVCFDALCHDVRAQAVQIGVESDAPMETGIFLVAKAFSPQKFLPVYLLRSGSITNGSLTFDLKQCRLEGKLELGIYRSNLSQPDSVYACDQKSFMEKSHRKALRFNVEGKYRSDAVMALLNWMATPGNNL